MDKLVIGILAHVDAGKTTLSESLLYLSGKIRKLGRVDNKDAFLDNYELERARGITIFSKQAILELAGIQVFLLDTPGHVDFSTEMERTLQVLDYAILVVNGAEGIQGHTKTLWRLLDIYHIPVFIFVNKMDQKRNDKSKILYDLKKQLDEGCIDFSKENMDVEGFNDQLAMCDEVLLEDYLETGHIEARQVKEAISKRKIFPCFFGSALKLEGIEEFIQGIVEYAVVPSYPPEFGARIFKIGRDELGNRLTYMKITGGTLKVRDLLSNGAWEEKVNQIRLYSGQRYEAVNEAEAGSVCAVTGLSQTKPGEGLGLERANNKPIVEPVLSYRIILPEGCDPRVMIPKLRQLEEEDPGLHIVWDELLKEIKVQVMGDVQVEILQSLIQSRFGVDVAFDSGSIVYKETIANVVEGAGHFEPLRHYAEVHLLMEPGERGSGLRFAVACSDDVLAKSWKNLVLTHLEEKVHKGVLTGAAITDIKITLVSGRAHNKHTEGGDFREATYRAVRQGLKEAESVLLEPYYMFQLELPEKMVGRAMSDIEKMHGTCRISHIEGEMAVLEGKAPVITMRNYQKDVTVYTKGLGRLFCSLAGYEPCHNTEEVVAMSGYDSERDVENPTGSVFCANGTSFLVSWDKVKDYMHIESCLKKENNIPDLSVANKAVQTEENWIDQEEIDKIFKKTFYANQGKKTVWKKHKSAAQGYYKPAAFSGKLKELKGYRELKEQKEPKDLRELKVPKEPKELKEPKEEYLLVDGYNIIFAWPELKELAEKNMDSARSKLLDYLSKYQVVCKCRIIAVFDAYRVQGHKEEIIDYDNIHVVYTGEAQTADHFIEKFANVNYKKYNIVVATSDGLQQIIIRGSGCAILSARELKEDIAMINEKIIQTYKEKERINRNYLKDALSDETKQQIEKLVKEDIDG